MITFDNRSQRLQYNRFSNIIHIREEDFYPLSYIDVQNADHIMIHGKFADVEFKHHSASKLGNRVLKVYTQVGSIFQPHSLPKLNTDRIKKMIVVIEMKLMD